MNDEIRIRKINLPIFIGMLIELHEKGVDFIDINGEIENGQDAIQIYFSRSYMDPEREDEFDDFEEEQLPAAMHVKLSDQDLNQLI